MQELSNNTVKTMSSLEIAKLTGKPHNDVLKDIRRILKEVEIGAGQFSHSYKSLQNKYLPCYNLPRRECDLIIAGYSAKYRLAIIDRWQELETYIPTLSQTLPEHIFKLQVDSGVNYDDALYMLREARGLPVAPIYTRTNACISKPVKKPVIRDYYLTNDDLSYRFNRSKFYISEALENHGILHLTDNGLILTDRGKRLGIKVKDKFMWNEKIFRFFENE